MPAARCPVIRSGGYAAQLRLWLPWCLLLLGIGPESMPGALNEYVLQRRTGYRDAVYFARKSLDYGRHQAMPLGPFQADRATHNVRPQIKPGAHAFCEGTRRLRTRSFKQ